MRDTAGPESPAGGQRWTNRGSLRTVWVLMKLTQSTQAPYRASQDRSRFSTSQPTVGIRPSGETEYCRIGDDDRGLELEIIGVIVETDGEQGW